MYDSSKLFMWRLRPLQHNIKHYDGLHEKYMYIAEQQIRGKAQHVQFHTGYKILATIFMYLYFTSEIIYNQHLCISI